MKPIRANINPELLEQTKMAYLEVKGLSATGVIDWALRKLNKEASDAI